MEAGWVAKNKTAHPEKLKWVKKEGHGKPRGAVFPKGVGKNGEGDLG